MTIEQCARELANLLKSGQLPPPHQVSALINSCLRGVDNRPGAGTNIAAEAVIRSAPDGYTLFLATPANAINAALYPSLNFNFMRDTAPIAGICLGPYVMVVNPILPTTTVPDFIAYAKANPGKINMASAGNGTPPHVFGELFKMMAGVDLVHVPYRSNYMPDLRTGTSVVQLRTGLDRVNPDRQAARPCGNATEAPADAAGHPGDGGIRIRL
jgi:hypothetical protein